MKRSTPLRRLTPLRRAQKVAARDGHEGRRVGLVPRSKKTAALYVQRRALVAGLLAERPGCEVPGCTRRSTEVHEPLTRARGGSVTDEGNCRAVCFEHHREIHDTEPAWAYEAGFLRHSWDTNGDAA